MSPSQSRIYMAQPLPALPCLPPASPLPAYPQPATLPTPYLPPPCPAYLPPACHSNPVTLNIKPSNPVALNFKPPNPVAMNLPCRPPACLPPPPQAVTLWPWARPRAPPSR